MFLTHVFPTGYGIKIWKGRTLGSSNTDNYHSNHNLVPVDDQAYGRGQVSRSPSPNPAIHASFPTELPLLSMMRGLSAGLLKLDR